MKDKLQAANDILKSCMKGLNEENKKRLLKAIQEVAAVKQSLYLRQIK